ncbi:unnamed protein product, partial [Effrenium voratum]
AWPGIRELVDVLVDPPAHEDVEPDGEDDDMLKGLAQQWSVPDPDREVDEVLAGHTRVKAEQE